MKEDIGDIILRVRTLVADELKVPLLYITPSMGLYDHPLWDSITHVSILLRLESEYGLRLSDDIVDELLTIQQLANRVRAENDRIV